MYYILYYILLSVFRVGKKTTKPPCVCELYFISSVNLPSRINNYMNRKPCTVSVAKQEEGEQTESIRHQSLNTAVLVCDFQEFLIFYCFIGK